MTKQSMVLALFCVMGGTPSAQQAVVTPLMSKDLLESPGKELSMITDVHVVGRNASSTNKAKLLVFFVRDKGAAILVPAK
jgi:hypothetical protein